MRRHLLFGVILILLFTTLALADGGSVLTFPFENESTDRNLDWLGEGISELMIDRLQSEPGLYVLFRDERLGALGDYYSSLTAADGNVFAISQKGTVTVFSGSNALEVLARNEMGETVMSTPAIVDGRIYLRTEKRLMCFGK